MSTTTTTTTALLPAAPSLSAARERASRLVRRPAARLEAAGAERGDVPGWVLVTLMTAGLVIALWAAAGPLLTSLFVDAVSKVTGP